MRNTLLRKVLGFVGITISAASCGMLFAYVIAAAQLGFFIQFLLAIVALILATIAYFKIVVPKLWAWMNDADLKSVISMPGIRAQLDKYMSFKNAVPAAE
jgi:hypothetical protein